MRRYLIVLWVVLLAASIPLANPAYLSLFGVFFVIVILYFEEILKKLSIEQNKEKRDE